MGPQHASTQRSVDVGRQMVRVLVLDAGAMAE